MRILMITLFVAVLGGCASATYTPPSTMPANDFTSTVNADYDTAWLALIDHASSSFFAIDNFEKDSGLLTVSFGSSNPSEYIDCGIWVATWTDPDYSQRQHNGPYVDFLVQNYSGKLEGKMNISVRKVSDDQTRVRVNARYIFTSPPQTWTFDSGNSATLAVNAMAGTGTNQRTCRPTYQAERSIIEAVEGLVR